MYARVSSYDVPADAVESAVQGFEATGLEDWDGFHQAYLLVDRERGTALTITIWESEEALTASAERAKEARRQVMDQASGSITDVQNYEIVSTAERSGTRA